MRILVRGEIRAGHAAKLAAILAQCTGEITVVVDSGGGLVDDSFAMFNQLLQYGREKGVVTTIAVEASSGASLIFLGGSQRMAARSAQILIHSSKGGGDPLVKAANAWMLEIYASYCKQPSQIKAVLDSGQDFIWTPEAAVEWGLAHLVMNNNVENRYDFVLQ